MDRVEYMRNLSHSVLQCLPPSSVRSRRPKAKSYPVSALTKSAGGHVTLDPVGIARRLQCAPPSVVLYKYVLYNQRNPGPPNGPAVRCSPPIQPSPGVRNENPSANGSQCWLPIAFCPEVAVRIQVRPPFVVANISPSNVPIPASDTSTNPCRLLRNCMERSPSPYEVGSGPDVIHVRPPFTVV